MPYRYLSLRTRKDKRRALGAQQYNFMSIATTTGRIRQGGINCIFNEDRLTREQALELLSNDAKALFTDSKSIYETGNALSYQVNVQEFTFFAKEYKRRKLYKRILDRLKPACHLSFLAGLELQKADVPTPTPILAATMQSTDGLRQLLVTEFCENAMGLDQWVKENENAKRAAVLDELACLLADFHDKGFYSRHLRSANIMVAENDGERIYWFIDLDRMSKSSLLNASNYVSTVSRACFEFNEFLSPEERKNLLIDCFNSGLRSGIFTKPSQESNFVKRTTNQMKKRRGY